MTTILMGKQQKEDYQTLPGDRLSSEAMLHTSANHGFLSKDEQFRLGKIILESKDENERHEAINCLVSHNLRLVIAITQKYRGQNVPLADLVQEGNIGLIRAATKYDYRKGYRFTTYASFWIRQAVQRAVGEQGRTIRLPIHRHDKEYRIRRTITEIQAATGETPTIEALADRLEMEPNAIKDILYYSQQIDSLDKPLSNDPDSALFGDLVPDDTDDLDDVVASNIQREDITDVLKTLSAREARIIALRFGLMDGECLTLQEISVKFGLTRERIRQIEGDALRKLRHPLRTRMLRGAV